MTLNTPKVLGCFGHNILKQLKLHPTLLLPTNADCIRENARHLPRHANRGTVQRAGEGECIKWQTKLVNGLEVTVSQKTSERWHPQLMEVSTNHPRKPQDLMYS